MDAEAQVEANNDNLVCPKCGAEEEGFFCRSCGALLHGEDQVLCPRCHQIVPAGEFCNRCGQSLGGIALSLRQLAMAGDAFWVTSEATTSLSSAESTIFAPDETITLAEPDLPDWLEELPTREAPPEVEERIYPALQPIRDRQQANRSNSFLVVVLVFMFILMLGLIALALFVLLGGGG